jgi:hypothetical protein
LAAICLDSAKAQVVPLHAKPEWRTTSLWPLAELPQARWRVPPLPADDIPFGGDE